uniref:hypothetical protein n=1 Tax=Pseudomonas viridiflava TaxID=33069 RepID=UPI001981327C
EGKPTPPTKMPRTIKPVSDNSAEIFQSMGTNLPFTFDNNDFDINDCNISKVIKFYRSLLKVLMLVL